MYLLPVCTAPCLQYVPVMGLDGNPSMMAFLGGMQGMSMGLPPVSALPLFLAANATGKVGRKGYLLRRKRERQRRAQWQPRQSLLLVPAADQPPCPPPPQVTGQLVGADGQLIAADGATAAAAAAAAAHAVAAGEAAMAAPAPGSAGGEPAAKRARREGEEGGGDSPQEDEGRAADKVQAL